MIRASEIYTHIDKLRGADMSKGLYTAKDDEHRKRHAKSNKERK